jgi:hypothetical protein
MGGYDGYNRLHTAEKYVAETNQWYLIADMHDARSDSSAAVLNGIIQSEIIYYFINFFSIKFYK